MYKDGKGINIDKLGEVKGEFKSGLEVSVTIAGTKDNIKDIEAGFNQLVFFDGVFLHDPHSILDTYAEKFNQRKTKRYNHFAVHSNSPEYPSMALLIGNCTYPLSKELWDVAFSSHQYPLYIKFDIGELDITPNREAILYNPKSEALIKKRILEASQEIYQMLNNDKFFSFTSLPSYIEFMQGYNVFYKFMEGDECILKFPVTYDLCKLWGLLDTDITLCERRTPFNFNKIISSLYSTYVPQSLIKFIFKDGKYYSAESTKKRITYKSLIYAISNENIHVVCTADNRWGHAIKQYVNNDIFTDSILRRCTYSTLDFGYVLNKNAFSKVIYDILYTVRRLERIYNSSSKEASKLILHYLQSLPKVQTINATDVPDSYKIVRESTTTTVTPKVKKEKEIAVGVFRKSDKYDYNEQCYPPVRDCSMLSWSKLTSSDKPFIYSSTDTEEIEDLKALYRILSDVSQESKFYFISVAPSVIPKVQALHRGKTVTEFIHSNNNILRKLVTIDKEKFKHVLSVPSRFSDGLADFNSVKKLFHKYTKYTNASVYKEKQSSVSNLWEDIKKIYTEHNWYDFHIKSIQDNENLIKACKLMGKYRYIKLEDCFPVYYYLYNTKLVKLNSTGRKYLLLGKNY